MTRNIVKGLNKLNTRKRRVRTKKRVTPRKGTKTKKGQGTMTKTEVLAKPIFVPTMAIDLGGIVITDTICICICIWI